MLMPDVPHAPPAARRAQAPDDRPPLPPWVDAAAYPFRPRRFETGEGQLAYLDEGAGPPVVLVHGTPTWSFLYRHLVAPLVAGGHRVIAPDHLGFGLSDKPLAVGYRPEDHARRLAALLDALAAGDPTFRDLTVVVHDFGGPIGLSYAVEHPERIARLIICNTWLWALDGDPRIARGARIAAGPAGRWLYTRLNASPRWLIPAGFADRARLTPTAHRQYLAPFPDAASRRPLWELARALLGSSGWYDELWRRRERLHGRPTLLLWGVRDPGFGAAYLARWRGALPDAEVAELTDAGHFVQEEAAADVTARVVAFLARTGGSDRARNPAGTRP